MCSCRILLIVIFSLFLFSACDLIEPDPFYNKIPDGEHIASINIQDIEPYQHFAGYLTIHFTLDSANFSIENAAFFIDSTFIQVWDNPPYEISLDTRNWSEGEHQLIIGLIGSDMGIGNLIGLPTTLHSIPVIFDQTPPSSVTLESVNWDNTHPQLTWSQNTDPNFYSYIIKHYNTNIDTIRDISTTTFLDIEVEQIFGSEVASYSILVSNNDNTTESNTLPIGYGETLDVNSANNISPIACPTRDEVYIINHSKDELNVISTIDHSILAQISLNPYVENFRGQCLSLDGNVLFSWTNENIYRHDEITFENELFYDHEVESIIFGREDRFYNRACYLYGYNPITGEIFGWALNLLHNHTIGRQVWFAIQSDGNILYAVDPYEPSWPYEAATIYRIDVSIDESLNIIAEQQTNVGASSVKLTADDQFLIFHDRSQNIEKWNAESLEFIEEVSLPNGAGVPHDYGLQDLFLTSEYIYVAYRLYRNEPSDTGQVLKYRIDDMSFVDSWDFRYFPETLVVSRDETVMYVFTYNDPNGFIVPLN